MDKVRKFESDHLEWCKICKENPHKYRSMVRMECDDINGYLFCPACESPKITKKKEKKIFKLRCKECKGKIERLR